MSRLHITCLISLLCWLTLSLRASDNQPLSPVGTPVAEQTFHQADPIDFHWDSFSLLADSGSLIHDMPFSFALLPHGGEHRMPSYMVNVTGENVGAYRLLPNGVHFSEPATISLPYDEFLLPMGYKPKDIKTYYFDEDLAQWKELQRISVDTTQHVILSYTTHFTEFANAVIKLPEVPEMKAFVPTAMQDLPEVNPLQGITMIAPPTANNRGTAELTYPIELPAGRNGMQPNIDLHYSSAGGNDILGVGWSIAQPAITIDTRWGVPRYDDYWETEAYLLNGEQIVLHDDNGEPYPLPHQAGGEGFAVRKYGAVEYFARDTKNQDRIVRHGNSLDSIWWEVTDRFGTVSYYGYEVHDQSIDDNAIVRSGGAKNSIAYWALTYTIDIFGNYIHYSYTTEENEVYLADIEYTGNLRNGEYPTHSISINYSNDREDEFVNGRLGVLQKKLLLVSCITVHYNNIPNAQYVMDYEYGEHTLFKKRLTSVTKYDTPRSSSCEDYQYPGAPPKWDWSYLTTYLNNKETTGYENVVSEFEDDGEYPEELPGSVTTFQYQNAHTISNLFSTQSNATLPRSFSQSSNHSWSIGGTAAVGLGNIIALTSSSVGGNYSYSHSNGSVSTMMMDMNGDGLPDIVCKNANGVYYYKQLASGSFADSVAIPGLNELSREVSSSHSFGVQADFAANFSYTPTLGTTYTDIYFTDANGDGLPDLITPEGIKINHLVGGEPSFAPLVNTTEIAVGNSRCGDVSRTGEVDERLECTNVWELETVIPWQNLLHPTSSIHLDRPLDTSNNTDRPPFPISGDTNICQEGRTWYFYNQQGISPLSANGYSDDPSKPGDPTFYVEIDTTTYIPQIDSAWYSPDYHLEVVDGLLYVYHLETFCHEEDTLPDVDIVRVWVAPHGGTINLNSNLWLLPDSSVSRQMSRKADGVKYYIQHNSSLLDSASIGANRTDTIHISHSAISVQQHDVFLFRLSAKNNRRFDDTEWVHTIQYTSGASGTFNSANDYICSGRNLFVAPCRGITNVLCPFENEGTATPFVRIRKNGSIVSYSSTYTGILNTNDSISIEAYYYGTEPQWSKIHFHPHIHFTPQTNDTNYPRANEALDYYPDINIHCSSIISWGTHPFRKLFGSLHKGWGQFAYNNRDRDDIINYMSLQNTEDAFATYLNNNSSTIQSQFASVDTMAIREDMMEEDLEDDIAAFIGNANAFNPLETNSKWIAMHADSRTERYVAYGNLGATGKHIHSTALQLNSELINGEIDQDFEYDSAIPVSAEQGAPVTTVRKKNFSVQHCISAGFAMINGNFAFGTNEVKMDYTDMNGDGFPDFVSSSSIQYSTPWGGIEGGVKPQLVTLGSNYHTYSQGVGFSGSKNTWGKITSNGVNRLNLYNSSLGVGINGSYTYNHGRKTFMDINADGLPDMVNVTGDIVWYNLGYTFSEAEIIDENISINEGISHATSSSVSAGISGTLLGNVAGLENLLSGSQSLTNFLDHLHNFSLSQYSLSGGISSSVSTNSTIERQIDINGDGFPDKLFFNGNNVFVQLYTNSIPSSQGTISVPFTLTSTTGNLGVNAGLTVGFTPGVLPIKLCFGVQTTPWSGSATQVHSELIDINGDGFIDYILEPLDLDGNTINASVYYNQNGLIPVNMLTAVTNPTGQRIELSYEQTTPSVEQRGRTWRLASVKDSIIAEDESACHRYAFSYKNPYHDNFERTDFGYDSVTTIDNRTKVFTETFSNANFISKGEKMSDLLTDTFGHPYIGHSHCIGYKDIYNNPVDSPLCNDASIRVDYDYYQTDYYEGLSSPSVSTRYRLEYDQYHNLISYINEGDISISSDNWEQHITYATPDNNRWFHNLVSMPVIDSVTTGGGSVLRLSTAQYNSFGKPEWIIKRDPVSLTNASTYVGYDYFGNIGEMSLPEDANAGGNRPWYKYEYDHETHSFPSLIYNQHMVQQFMFYDNRFGLLEKVIDPSGYAIRYEYDRTGRLTNVYAPRALMYGGGGEPYTIHYRYGVYNHDREDLYPTYMDPYVIKVGLSEGNASIESTIYDARGHEKQKKHLARVSNYTSWIADGVRVYDAFYRLKKMSLPLISYTSMNEWDHHVPSADSMVFRYDILDRPIYQQNFDGTTRTDTFSFGVDATGILRLKHAVVDENSRTSVVLKSPQDWTIQTSTPDGFITKYVYNPIGELLRVTDADSYETTYSYDAFGNCTQRNHPDAGITRWTYAPAGNVETIQTNEHINNSQSIEYKYDFGRLNEIRYPFAAFNNTSYEYDIAGRVHKRNDGVGHEVFFYDELGNTRYSQRRILVPTETYSYELTTRHHFDSFGRVRYIVYSDGDTVRYTYYASSELESITHKPLGGSASTLMNNIRYDIFGHMDYQLYGNGLVCTYIYNPQRQWLTRKTTGNNYGSKFQDLNYKYDYVGNITQIDQQAGAWGSIGGPYTNDYTYDHQYRLLAATETSSSTFNVDFSASYSPAGRLGHDFCASNNVNKQLTYGYDIDGLTHQPRVIYDNETEQSYDLFWNANGNLAQIMNCKQEQVRFHLWDDMNRLLSVVGMKQAGFYGYNGNGERVWKLTGTCENTSQNGGNYTYSAFLDDAVLYPNPYITITPQGYTKHFYVGTERIATALGEGGWNNVIRTLSDAEIKVNIAYIEHFHNLPCEKYSWTKNENIEHIWMSDLQYSCDSKCMSRINITSSYNLLLNCVNGYQHSTGYPETTYFTHSDHLGSASWITDDGAHPVQYIHYAPYGELIANQRATTFDERYKFTGKERDAETGYDYFGARFLAQQLGIWLSVDPLADKYPSISPYAYCAWNPIKYVDPDGEDIWEMDENGMVLNRIEDKTQDAFRMNGKQISFAYGSVTGDFQTNNQTVFTFNNEEVAANAFKFMADNSSVEYGLIIAQSGNSTIVTQHNERGVLTTPITLSLSKKGEKITTIIHNHPSNNGCPSGYDGKNEGDRKTLITKEKILNYSIDAFTYTSKSSMLQRYSPNNKNVGTVNWGVVFPSVGQISHQSSSLNTYIMLPYYKWR